MARAKKPHQVEITIAAKDGTAIEAHRLRVRQVAGSIIGRLAACLAIQRVLAVLNLKREDL